jgi:hypothetical protein
MRFSHLTASLAMALALAGAAACGPATPEPVAPPAPTGAALPAPVASGTPAATPAATPGATPAATPTPTPAGAMAFSTMSNEQKLAHMKTVIMPGMSKIFQEGDPKRYGDFGCKTCHGDKKQDPHVVLPKLTLSGDGFQKMMAAKPAVTKFMAEKVTPAMATAMGEKPYDPATHKGFGCGGCHAVN